MGVAAAGAVAGLAGGAYQFFEGRSQARRAQSAINQFEPQELTNPFENLQVSTLGADLQREEQARLAATQVEALRGGGVRGILGGLGKVQAQSNLVNRQIGAGLDLQQKQIDFAGAQDETRIQAIQEQRDREYLAGLGQQLNVGQQLKYQGLGNFARGLTSGGQLIDQL